MQSVFVIVTKFIASKNYFCIDAFCNYFGRDGMCDIHTQNIPRSSAEVIWASELHATRCMPAPEDRVFF